MSLDWTLKAKVTLLCGAQRTGKTTGALRMAANIRYATRFFFDAEGEFAARINRTPARTCHELDIALIRGLVVFDPHDLFPGRLDAAFSFFCDWIFTRARRLPGRKLFVVDEAWRYCAPNSIPQSLRSCVQSGGKRGVELAFTTQNPQQLNGAILAEVTEVVCFRLNYERALDVITGARNSIAPEIPRHEIPRLADTHFIAADTKTGAVFRGRIPFSKGKAQT